MSQTDHSACNFAGQPVRCDRCGAEYTCTPTNDYYCTPQGDHCCEPCLLAGAGFPGPARIAFIDQQLALASELLDGMVAEVRALLDSGVSAENAVLRVAATAYTVEPERVGTALAVALVRLARQTGGAS